jgi:hypothetical protein
MSEHDPREDYDDEPWKAKCAPDHVVRWPASAMWVFALVQLLLSVVGLILLSLAVLVRAVSGGDDTTGSWRTLFLSDDFLIILIVCIVGLTANYAVLRGAAGMGRFRRYPWAVSASVLTLLSIPFIYFAVFTVPVGVWALIVLCRRDVRARFAANAREKASGAA